MVAKCIFRLIEVTGHSHLEVLSNDVPSVIKQEPTKRRGPTIKILKRKNIMLLGACRLLCSSKELAVVPP